MLNFYFQKDEDLINFLRNELMIAQNKIKILEQEKLSLEESLRLSHIHKDLMREEMDKIQEIQNQEINKLKNLLHFREQVCVYKQLVSYLFI